MKHILITGVSSGIGEAIADLSIKKGYKVFGSVRNDVDVSICSQRWGASFIPLKMDIRDVHSIKKNFNLVKSELKGKRLDVLVNNSGVAKTGPLELQNIEDIREMFEVNLLGLIQVTQTFLPLMKVKSEDKKSSGKIINISSVAGKLAFPFLGAYAASKHAVEGISHSLRRELMPWGIDVVMVAPGNVWTPIWNKAEKQTLIEESPYKTVFQNFLEFALREARKGMTPESIADVVMTIINSQKSEVRYAPVANKFANWYLPRLLSARAMDKMVFKMLGMEKQA